MNDRAEPVLAVALERLVDDGTLSRQQADAVRVGFRAQTASRPEDEKPRDESAWSLILTEVGGYVGAAFVTAAALALVGPNWDHFSRAGRVGLLTGPAVFLLVAAFAVVSGRAGPVIGTGPRRRLVSTLVLAGGGLLGAAAAVLADGHAGADRWISLVPLIVWAAGYLLWRGVGLHLGTGVALTWTAFAVLGDELDERWPWSGLLLVLAGVGWAALTRRRVIEEQALGIAVAGVMAFIGGETVVISEFAGPGYLLLGLLAIAGLVGYLRTRELSALGVGAGALAVVVPQAVLDYTEGSLSTAGALLVCGMSVVVVSVLAGRLRRISGPTELV